MNTHARQTNREKLIEAVRALTVNTRLADDQVAAEALRLSSLYQQSGLTLDQICALLAEEGRVERSGLSDAGQGEGRIAV